MSVNGDKLSELRKAIEQQVQACRVLTSFYYYVRELTDSESESLKTDDDKLAFVATYLRNAGSPYDAGWLKIDAADAKRVLRKMLSDSVAYTHNELDSYQPNEAADGLCAAFMSCFDPEHALFLTGWEYNASLPNAKKTGEEVSYIHADAMFEVTLIAIDSEKLVVLIIEEED